jgi:hypothetical protein
MSITTVLFSFKIFLHGNHKNLSINNIIIITLTLQTQKEHVHIFVI